MLKTIGCTSLDDLINKTIPKEIITHVCIWLFKLPAEDEAPPDPDRLTRAPASPALGRAGVLVWVVSVLSVLWEKGVVWGFARLEGVLPKIPILKKVRKVPGIRAGGARGVWRRRHWRAVLPVRPSPARRGASAPRRAVLPRTRGMQSYALPARPTP